MKKHLLPLRLFVALFTAIYATGLHSAVVPYLPPLQNFGGTSANLSTFVPTEADFTLEVQGSIGTQISIAGGLITYTPSTNGTVRFSQKNGVVLIYEGNVYKTSITPTYTIAYPSITDADVTTNSNNLIRNASFETAGSLVGGTNYNFGTPWVTNVTVPSSAGIRFTSSTAGNVSGTWEIVWRGSGNSNYFAQPLLATIKPNTTYKFIVRQIAGGNAYANFQFGLGSTNSGQEYGFSTISLGSTKDGLWNTTMKTPQNISGTTYFTFKNTAANTASSGSDPVTQMDYIALVEGYVNASTAGISGVSSANILTGSAYSPENITLNFEGGDNFDLTSFIINPSFEMNVNSNSFYGWSNNGMARQNNTPGNGWTKDGSYYIEKWIASGSNLPAASINQSLSNLPNGYYQLSMSGHAIQQSNSSLVTTGAFVFAGAKSTAVNIGGNYSVNNIPVTDGTLNIGYKLEAPITCNWTGFDNFKLYYIGPELYPSITAPQSSIGFTTTVNSANIDITGTNLTSDITITVPSSNITLTGSNITGSSPNYTIALANANSLNTVTATWDKTANTSGNISFTSGAKSKTITISTVDVESVALAGITLNNGGILSPGFSVSTTSYSTKVPADINNTTVSATTSPSIGNVTNSGTSISADVSSVILTGNSYNGTGHTSTYTVNWGGNYTLDDWDANGSTDATLSVPSVYGWTATNSLTWSYANSSVISSRYFDFANGANGSNPSYTYQGNKFTGRVLLLRLDGGRVYSYPVKLIGGRTYNFSAKHCFHSTGTAGTITFGFYSDKLSTTSLGAVTSNLSSTAGLLQDASLTFTPESTGVYYLNISNNNGNLCSITDLQLTDNGASLSAINPSSGTLVPSFNSNINTYKVIVPDGTTSVTTNITKTDANAAVTGDGSVTLTNGIGTSTIVVTSADGFTSKTYTVNYFDQELKLKHAYTFEDGSANDSPANGATSVNGTISGTGTVSGGTYNPTTDGDYITLSGANLALASYPAITLEAFITSGTTYENTYSMLAYFGAASGTQAFWIQPTRNGSDNSQNEFWGNAINGIELNDGAKHHLVSILTSDSLYFYTDGYLVGKTKNTVAISNISPTVAYLGKGGWSDPSWLGSLHEFNIYSGKMDAATVKSRALNFVPATTYAAGTHAIAVSKSASSIVVEPGAKLTINASKRLAANTITIQSNENGTAALENNGTLQVTTANIQQYLTSKSAVDKTDNWWYISSPVSNATSGVILTEGSGNKFGYYNEATATYPQITATDVALTAGKGYVSQINTTGTYTFSGTLNNGDVPVTLTRTGNTELKRGYNLVGNPYLSFLNWTTVKGDRTDIRSTVWFRTRTAAGAMTFDTFNGLEGTSLGKNGTVTQYIPPMQAFWVKVHEDATSGDPLVNTINLTLTNNMRSHQDQTLAGNRLRAPQADEKQIVRINVSNGTNKDEAILMSYTGALDLMDTYDAEKISNNNIAIPEIYTLLNNEEITINTMNSLPLNMEIPLGFRTGQAGNFSISATEITNLGTDVKLILKDKLTSSETELTVDYPYNFTSEAMSTTDRFTVMLKATGVTTDVNQFKSNLLIYGNENNQIVISGLITEGTPVYIFNAVGQQIYQGQLNNSYSVINQKLEQGVYLVKINQSIQKVTLK